jgi:hypothetical protein
MKKVKMSLSIAAVMFAMVGALATSASENGPLVNKKQVSDPTEASCPLTGYCDIDVAGSCYVSGTSGPIYKFRLTGPASCNVDATGTFSTSL